MKKISYVLIVVGLLLVINSLAHSILDLWSKQDLVDQAQNRLNSEKKENESLKNQLRIVQSKGFVEEQARDKLFMAKPGEKEVILPESGSSPSSTSSDNQPQLANWQKWINIFFPS